MTQLERREHTLREQLRKLNAEGPGLRQNIKAVFQQMGDDIAANLQDFVISLDASRLHRG